METEVNRFIRQQYRTGSSSVPQPTQLWSHPLPLWRSSGSKTQTAISSDQSAITGNISGCDGQLLGGDMPSHSRAKLNASCFPQRPKTTSSRQTEIFPFIFAPPKALWICPEQAALLPAGLQLSKLRVFSDIHAPARPTKTPS